MLVKSFSTSLSHTNDNIIVMIHSLAYEVHSKCIKYMDNFLESSKQIFQVAMDNMDNMDNSNLIKIVAAIVTVSLVACSLWYYPKNKNETKVPKIDSQNKNCSTPEESNKSTISAEDDTFTETSSQEKGGSMKKTLGTQEESSSMIKSIKSSQASCQEQPSIIQSGSINVNKPESASKKPKNYEEMPENRLHIPKYDSPIMETGINHTATPKVAENGSQAISSSHDNEDVYSTPVETCPLPNEDASEIQTELQCSRSILLNDQLPISMPLPNETPSDMVNEFRYSNVVHAFTGQDLIDLEDYDEEEEIRRLLVIFKHS